MAWAFCALSGKGNGSSPSRTLVKMACLLLSSLVARESSPTLPLGFHAALESHGGERGARFMRR